MPNTTYKIVQPRHLKNVLDNLYHGNIKRDLLYAFQSLHIIQAYLKSIDHLPFGRAVVIEYAVQVVLSRIIHSNLAQQRRNLAIPHRAFDALESQKQAIHDIQQDALTQSKTLMAWSLLYHVHIRPDFNLTYTDFAKLINVNVRTVNRYKHLAYKLVMQALMESELQVADIEAII